MLEYSDVPIPSNPAALQIAIAKGLVLPEIESQIEKELITKPEETMNMYRIPVDEGNHKDHKIRTIDVSKEKGIKGLYCVDDKKIITYMFDKEKWASMGECQQWVKDHSKEYIIAEDTNSDSEITYRAVKQPDTIQIYNKHDISQEELIDDIDYLRIEIEKTGLSNKAKQSLKSIVIKYFKKGDDSDYADDAPVFTFKCIKCGYEELGDLSILLTIEQQKCTKCNGEMKLKKSVIQDTTIPVEKNIEVKEEPVKENSEELIKKILNETVKQVVNNS
jgi:hypothetical protein